MEKKQYSLLLKVETIKAIDDNAAALNRSRNNLIELILSQYIDHIGWERLGKKNDN